MIHAVEDPILQYLKQAQASSDSNSQNELGTIGRCQRTRYLAEARSGDYPCRGVVGHQYSHRQRIANRNDWWSQRVSTTVDVSLKAPHVRIWGECAGTLRASIGCHGI